MNGPRCRRAVLTIENSMSVQDAHAMLSYQCFNRLARYFGIVAQLHRAPAVFVRAVHEVARRRAFSLAHLRVSATPLIHSLFALSLFSLSLFLLHSSLLPPHKKSSHYNSSHSHSSHGHSSHFHSFNSYLFHSLTLIPLTLNPLNLALLTLSPLITLTLISLTLSNSCVTRSDCDFSGRRSWQKNCAQFTTRKSIVGKNLTHTSRITSCGPCSLA